MSQNVTRALRTHRRIVFSALPHSVSAADGHDLTPSHGLDRSKTKAVLKSKLEHNHDYLPIMLFTGEQRPKYKSTYGTPPIYHLW
jgi:hypothetical protein